MNDQRTMDNGTMAVYFFLLLAVIGVFILGLIYDAMGDVLISLPIMALIVLTIFNDKQTIHIPPALVILVVGVMYVSLVSRIVGGGFILDMVQRFLIGVVIGLAGLIVVYMLLRELPGFERERPALVSLLVFTFSIAIYTIWMMIEFFILSNFMREYNKDLDMFMAEMLWVAAGSMFIALFFYLGRSTAFFNATIVRFLKKNSDAIGIEPELSECEMVKKLISEGESETLEFKSTLRTNLVTGEKDKRMEKAVLKTIVAFLNTGGGTLLIGVADDGRISGIDLESFESRDKMNLHMTNLISSQIGNEFLPFIDFRVIDFENVCVMRVDCEPTYHPVFLYENKLELYYVRSGPSSVELIGMDLINYVNIRKENGEQEGGRKRRKSFKLKR